MRCTSTRLAVALLLIAMAQLWSGDAQRSGDAQPADRTIRISGDEQRRLDLTLPDGGLKPVVGVNNVQVFRTCRGRPEVADQDGWTYAHHQDLAVWKGRLYAAWAMTPTDEDVPPYKVVYATSTDGLQWSAPADLFPRENAWACRFYFYRAGNGRMLAFCAGKSGDGTVTEATKRVLLVREITADHHLGPVFTLVAPPLAGQPPAFEQAKDPEFITACRDALGNTLLLEQQDYGIFLGGRRMRWHAKPPKFGGNYPFGKALCFYHRPDGLLIGLSKMGFFTCSTDAGRTWSTPVVPPTLIAGSGKIWGQRTADGRFALSYHPTTALRHPLVLVHGDDGREFRDMRVVHGEYPRKRYPGLHKDPGPQYMRGLAEWADDGSLADRQAMWLICSMHKEDIWISRIPLPIKPDEAVFPADDFSTAIPGMPVQQWNTYSPRWAPVAVVDEDGRRCLELRDGDPFDYARAVRVFPATARVRIELRLRAAQTTSDLDIDVCDAQGRRPVRVRLAATGLVQALDEGTARDLGTYAAGTWMTIVITTDLAANHCTVQVDEAPAQRLAVAEKRCASVERLSLRTGPWRGLGDGGAVDPAADAPLATPARFQVASVIMRNAAGQ